VLHFFSHVHFEILLCFNLQPHIILNDQKCSKWAES
jgi:hypothetical protein